MGCVSYFCPWLYDSLLSLSYLLQWRYIKPSRMCLVENAQHEKIFAYIQSVFTRIKPRVNCFVHHCCFVFENLIVSSKSLAVRDPRKILRVSWNSKLDSQSSKIETRAFKLDSRFSKTLRIENWVETVNLHLNGTVFTHPCIALNFRSH